MQKIVVVSGSSLCCNPRVVKEATALSSAGFAVEVLGAWTHPELKVRDLKLLAELSFQFTPVLDVAADRWSWIGSRLCMKAARLWHQRTALETHWQLGYPVQALVRAVAQREAALFIAHSESAMWAVAQLQGGGRRRFRVGVDMEDWFSEDLTAESRKERPVKLLRTLEQKLLQTSAYSICTSRAMSRALSEEYNCPPPSVIYNAFAWADRDRLDGKAVDRKNLDIPSIHWYSQTLGAGRGIEDLVAALPHVKAAVEVHLRGQSTPEFRDWLMSRLPCKWQSRVFIHSLVSNEELLSRISEHDIGFAGEMNYCRSRDLTVTNKILHYLLGGLAVVASDTTGQKEVAAQATGSVRLYRSGDSHALAQELNILLDSKEELRLAKEAALRAAEECFCWEREATRLVEIIGGVV